MEKIERIKTIYTIETKYSVKVIRKISNSFYIVTKRLFDIIFSMLGLICLLPIAFIIKISYLLTGDFHAILFTQKRIGKNGKEFNFFKFRTMIPNADQALEKLMKENNSIRDEYNKNKKLNNDPRITKIGKLIRKFSIDELPQLINIFLGQMSFIGNRPYLPREKNDMGKRFNVIVSTKPGLTGFWQVNGRSDVSFEKRLELEEYYSLNHSLILDIKIFFKTFKVVLFGSDAK